MKNYTESGSGGGVVSQQEGGCLYYPYRGRGCKSIADLLSVMLSVYQSDSILTVNQFDSSSPP